MIRDAFAPEWLSIQQVMQLSGRSYSTVMRAIRDHRLRAYQQDWHCSWRVNIADFDAWMRGRRPEPERSTRRAG